MQIKPVNQSLTPGPIIPAYQVRQYQGPKPFVLRVGTPYHRHMGDVPNRAFDIMNPSGWNNSLKNLTTPHIIIPPSIFWSLDFENAPQVIEQKYIPFFNFQKPSAYYHLPIT